MATLAVRQANMDRMYTIQWNTEQKGTYTMFKLVLLVIALVGGYMVLQSLPDIQRYLRIRAM